MPLIRISLRQGKTAEYKNSMVMSVYTALRETFNVPEDDLFALVHDHDGASFMYGKNYLDITRTDELIIIQITVSNTRTAEQKKALYAHIVELLGENICIRPENVFINLLEVGKENWSFGSGVAQYA